MTEAVLIEMKEKDGLLLNSKGGFNRCALPRIQVAIGDKAWEGHQKEKEREKTRITYKCLEDKEEENRELKVDDERKASEKTSVDNLKLLKRPKFKSKKSKNFIPNNFKFIPLSKVFDMMERKPDLGGPDDRGSRHQDKRRAGDG